MADPVPALTAQFLSWVDECPRSYAETMEAWRTSCPRLSVWEDATLAGLVRLEAGGDGRARVVVTAQGRAFLAAPRPLAATSG